MISPPTFPSSEHRTTVSVVIPAHNPHLGRLARVFTGLSTQTLPPEDWETLLVDNASAPALDTALLPAPLLPNLRVLREPSLGLTAARRCGLRASLGEFCVLVDDDNVLASTYLADVVRVFREHTRLGAAGGPSRPEFDTPPPEWAHEFFPLLALRDRGVAVQLAGSERSSGGSHVLYPECAPIGAGMALRRDAIVAWIDSAGSPALIDRCGPALTSGGDNDIVLTLLHGGWQVGYFPELALAHLIPASRLDPGYLARLNRGIQTSWMQVLAKHDANPWPSVPRWTVPLRQLKAWFALRAWTGQVARIRWQGACGHFAGRARAALTAMGKLHTAFSLLTSGSLPHFRRRLRINIRGRCLRRAAGHPFAYRLAGFPFVCVPGISDSEEIFLTGDFDRMEFAILRDWLAPGDAFIDVGTNLGLYTFCAHHHLRGSGTFLAIEASPELARNLATSARLLGVRNVIIEQTAAGDETKDAVFYIAPPGKSTGEQSLHPDPVRSADYVPHCVRMLPLVEIVGRHPATARPAAVKLDIEGAEPLALRGAPAEWFTSSGPLWIVEINPTALARAGSSCAAIVGRFPTEDFTCWLAPHFSMAGQRNLPVRTLAAGETFTDAWFYNLIAAPRAQAFSARAQRIARHLSAA